jgi:hypothetical protein
MTPDLGLLEGDRGEGAQSVLAVREGLQTPCAPLDLTAELSSPLVDRILCSSAFPVPGRESQDTARWHEAAFSKENIPMTRLTLGRNTVVNALTVVCLVCVSILSSNTALAQGDTSDIMSDDVVFDPGHADDKIITDGNLMLKTKVIYRGLIPSTGPAIVGNFGGMYKHIVLYLYGGAGFTTKYPAETGNYQETDINLFYYRSKWDVGFNYFYNFTNGITTVPEPSGIFNFDPETARGVLDLIGRVRFGKHNQWQLMSSTYVWAPRDSKGTEKIDEEGNSIPIHGDQRHSQYVEILKTWKIGEHNKIKAAVGGSWAWTSDDNSTFYGSKAGINNIELHFVRYFEAGEKFVIPVKASAAYNPLSDNMYVYFTIELIHNTKIGH